jgi:hypothetical protein
MANSAFTLINIVILEMIKRSFSDFRIRYIAGNDDAVLACSRKKEQEEVGARDEQICEGLSLELSDKKCFYSLWYQFFEEYNHPDFKDKIGRAEACYILCYMFGDEFSFRYYVNALIQTFGKVPEHILKYANSVFGIPMDPNLPFEFGGFCCKS